jgi:hypothetical protein
LLSEKDVSAARDQFVDEIVKVALASLQPGVREMWLDLAASVKPGSDKVKAARKRGGEEE